MPLNQNHPLLRDASELFEKLSSWQNDPVMTRGSSGVALALKMADYSHPIFQDSLYPEYALLALHQDSISEAQFTTVMSLWAANQDFQPQVFEHKITSTDPYTPENKALRQFLTLSTNENNNETQMSDKEFRTLLEKLTAENVPESEKVYFTFQVPSNSECSKVVQVIRDGLGFKAFMPRSESSAIGAPDVFIIPSLTLVQSFIDALAKKPVHLQPTIGASSQQAVLANHESDQHPVGISFPDFLHSYADKLKSGAFGFILHDYYHALLLMNNSIRAAFNRIAHLAVKFKQQNQEDAGLIDAMIERLTDQEFRLFYELNKFDSLKEFGHENAFFFNLFQMLFLPNAMILDDEIKSRIEKISKDFIAAQQENENIDFFVLQELEEKIAQQTIEGAKLAPVVYKFLNYIFVDVINHPQLWHENFDISATVLYQNLMSGRNYFKYLRLFEAYKRENNPIVRIFKKNMTEEEMFMALAEKFYPAIVRDMEAALAPDKVAGKSEFSPEGLAWLEKQRQVEADMVAAIKQDDKEALEKAANCSGYELSRAFEAMEKYLIQCIEQQAHTCLAYLLAEVKTLNDVIGEIKLINERDILELGDRLLHLAAKRNNGEAVKLICAHQQSVAYLDLDKRSPLDYCLENGDVIGASACLRKSFADSRYLRTLQKRSVLPKCSIDLIESYFQFQAQMQNAIKKGNTKEVEAILLRMPSFDINTPIVNGEAEVDDDNELTFPMDWRSNYTRPLHLLFSRIEMMGEVDQAMVGKFKEWGADPALVDSKGNTVAASYLKERQVHSKIRDMFFCNERSPQQTQELAAQVFDSLESKSDHDQTAIYTRVLNALYMNDVDELRKSLCLLQDYAFQQNHFVIDLINMLRSKKWDQPNQRACLELLLQAGLELNRPFEVQVYGMDSIITVWSRLLEIRKEDGLPLPIDIIELCIRYGADVNLPMSQNNGLRYWIGVGSLRDGLRLLDYAIEAYFTENADKAAILALIQLLLRQGAKLNYFCQKENGAYLSPLRAAVEQDDMNLVITFLSRGADPRLSHAESCSALERAKQLKKTEMINVLENFQVKSLQQPLPAYALSKVKSGQYRKLITEDVAETPANAIMQLQGQLNQIVECFESYCYFSDDELDALFDLAKQASSNCKPVLFGRVMAEFMGKLAAYKAKLVTPTLLKLKEKVRLLQDKLEQSGDLEMGEVSQLRITCATELLRITQALGEFEEPKELTSVRVQKENSLQFPQDLAKKLSLAPKSTLFQMAPEIERDARQAAGYRTVSSNICHQH